MKSWQDVSMMSRQERSGEVHQPETGPQILYTDTHKSHNYPSRNVERDPFLEQSAGSP